MNEQSAKVDRELSPCETSSEASASAAEGITILVPVYNEREGIQRAIDEFSQLSSSMQTPVEILFVDDGSDDGTAELLDGIKASRLRVLRHEHNRGYGAALKSGIRAARYPWIGIADADLTYPIEELAHFHRLAIEEDLDMVVGARVGPRAQIPAIRKPAKWALRTLARYLTKERIPDLNSGLRVMRLSLLQRFRSVLPNGFSFTTTITLAMLCDGFRVRYVPIDYAHRVGQSKIRPIYDTLNFLQLICRTVLYFNPLRIFVPLSLALLVAAIAIICGSWLYLDKVLDVTFGVTIMTAVITMVLGLLADMISKRV